MRSLAPSVLLAPVIALGVALAGCSDDDGAGAPSATPDAAITTSAEDCDDLAGTTMPADFEGCVVDDVLHTALGYDCDDGRSLWVAGPAYGFVGEPVEIDPEGVDGGFSNAAWSECFGYEIEPEYADPS